MASLSSSSSPSSAKKLVSLKSFEGEIFQVDERVALQSETIKSMMNEGNNGDIEFPVPNVKSKTLEKVIEYCEKHVVVVVDEDLSAWDLEFVKSFNTTVLYHLLLASKYLEVKGLMDLIIRRVANMIDGKMPEEIRKTFGLKNDFAPGEEEQIRIQNPWAFEIPPAHNTTPSHNDAKVVQEKLDKLEIVEPQ